MREFKKANIVFYFNIVIFVVLASFATYFLTKRNPATTAHMGFDLFLFISLAFYAFSISFLVNTIRFLILPTVLITINKNEVIVHKRKKEYHYHASRVLGVSKENTQVSEVFGMNVGTLKILVRDTHKPIYVKHLADIEYVYQTINLLTIKYFEYSNTKNIK